MRLIGKDNGKHVVEVNGTRLHVNDAELDALKKEHGFKEPEANVKKRTGFRVIGRDNGKHVVEIDGERKHVNDVELAALKGVRAVKKAIAGPPEDKAVIAPEETKAAVKKRAEELGIKTKFRKFEDIAADVAAKEAELAGA